MHTSTKRNSKIIPENQGLAKGRSFVILRIVGLLQEIFYILKIYGVFPILLQLRNPDNRVIVIFHFYQMQICQADF